MSIKATSVTFFLFNTHTHTYKIKAKTSTTHLSRSEVSDISLYIPGILDLSIASRTFTLTRYQLAKNAAIKANQPHIFLSPKLIHLRELLSGLMGSARTTSKAYFSQSYKFTCVHVCSTSRQEKRASFTTAEESLVAVLPAGCPG